MTPYWRLSKQLSYHSSWVPAFTFSRALYANNSTRTSPVEESWARASGSSSLCLVNSHVTRSSVPGLSPRSSVPGLSPRSTVLGPQSPVHSPRSTVLGPQSPDSAAARSTHLRWFSGPAAELVSGSAELVSGSPVPLVMLPVLLSLLCVPLASGVLDSPDVQGTVTEP